MTTDNSEISKIVSEESVQPAVSAARAASSAHTTVLSNGPDGQLSKNSKLATNETAKHSDFDPSVGPASAPAKNATRPRFKSDTDSLACQLCGFLSLDQLWNMCPGLFAGCGLHPPSGIH